MKPTKGLNIYTSFLSPFTCVFFVILIFHLAVDSAVGSCAAGKFFDATSGNCYDCPTGFYCAGLLTAAIPCAAGKFNSNTGQSLIGSCQDCSAGWYSAEGAAVCTECPPGFACPSKTAAPVACAAGKFSIKGQILCSDCPKGSYCPSTAGTPIGCPSGTYADAFDQTICSPCPAGSSCSDPAVAPVQCNAGELSLKGAATCSPCPVGLFSVVGATICTPCPGGQECPGQKSPVNCAKGFYSELGEGACKACPTGTYSDAGASFCLPCPAGKVCADPKVLPIDCGTGEYSTSGTVTACIPCPAGSQCPSKTVPPTLCPIGTYSGPKATACIQCPAGSSCVNPAEAPVACPSGYYSSLGDVGCHVCPAGNPCSNAAVLAKCNGGEYSSLGSSTCLSCPAGSFCPDPAQAPSACTPGQYSIGGTQTCTTCPAGKKCPSTSSGPTDCLAGTFSLQGSVDCMSCAAGFACPSISSLPTPCAAGSYSSGGATACIQCPAGEACPSTRDPGQKITCALGTFSTGGAQICTACPAGFKCASTTSNSAVQCTAGTFSTGGASACTTCPAGVMCPNTDGSGNSPCPVGSYSLAGQTSCTPCNAGFYCPTVSVNTQIACPVGTYSLQGAASCTVCPPGKACPSTNTDNNIVTCASGTFSVKGSTACTQCPAGFFCPAVDSDLQIPCENGWYSLAGATKCTLCPAGSFCADTKSNPTPCPSGTYSLGGKTSSCTQCPAGYECKNSGTTVPEQCTAGKYSLAGSIACSNCNAGYLCPAGSTVANPAGYKCPVGYHCDGATATACAAGTYNDQLGGMGVGSCKQCLAGYYCVQGTGTLSALQLCPKGYFCPTGTDTVDKNPCTAGTYNDQYGKIQSSDCKACPVGKFCLQATANQGTMCPQGYFCPVGTAFSNANPCPAGQFGKQPGAEDSSYCQDCPKGHYCLTGSSSPTVCPAGRFNAAPGGTNLNACTQCNAGSYCPTPGLTTAPFICRAGHYCPQGSINPTPCNAGTYTDAHNLNAQSQCSTCKEGWACPSGTGGSQNPPQICAKGHYCPAGTPSTTSNPCSAGTYTANTGIIRQADCTDCPKGDYCTGGKDAPDAACPGGHYCPPKTPAANSNPCPAGTYYSLTGAKRVETCIPCTKGHFCPAGSVNPTACPAGTYNDILSQKQQSDCKTCTPGYKCPSLGVVTPLECGTGKYSSAGASVCASCQAGFYCDEVATSQTTMTTKKICPKGTNCPTGQTAPPDIHTDFCPKGHWCDAGNITPAPQPCTPGTYNPLTSRTQITDCVKCPPGKYCQTSGLFAVSGPCKPGHYCPEGTVTQDQFPCAAGKYLENASAENEAACSTCVSGNYCPQGTATPIKCPQGFYCPTGTINPQPCPQGTYGATLGLRRSQECTPCPGGKFCLGLGASVPTGNCDAGFYCISKASASSPPNDITGGLCPKGGYCPVGSAAPVKCPIGTFGQSTGAKVSGDCVACTPGSYCAGSNNPSPTGPCDPGYFCPGGSTTPTDKIVPQGHFSLQGAAAASPCLPGTYQPGSGQGICNQCLQGNYCPGQATITPTPCTAGNYCPTGSSAPQPCPAGTFSNKVQLLASGDCTQCTPGMFCASTGLNAVSGQCDAGYVCTGGSKEKNPVGKSYGDVCPAGHYCPVGTHTPVKCPIGKFSATTGNADSSKCIACSPGSFCASQGLNSPSGQCKAGYYCTLGATTDSPTDGSTGNKCTVGHYCPQGTSVPKKCPPGTYMPNTQASVCLDCPAGSYCVDGINVLDCPASYYCPVKTGSNWQPCPAGTYSNTKKLAAESECTKCDSGKFCANAHSTAVSGDCSPGYFCTTGVNTATPDGTTNTGTGGPCSKGHYCPLSTGTPVACPQGKFNPSLGSTSDASCTVCSPGKYCTTTGLPAPTGDCTAGYYCTSGSIVPNPATVTATGGPCPTAHYCPTGSSAPLECVAGTYSPSTTASICQPCPAGYFCPVKSNQFLTNNCPQGYFCPQGTKAANESPCPEGSFGATTNLQSQAACTTCTAGKFCQGLANTAVDGPCQAGWYCPAGSKSATPSGKQCQPGHYCPEGSATQLPCDPGFYCQGTLQSVKTGQCTAGYFCSGGASTPAPTDGTTGNICPAGSYCPANSGAPTPCAVGKFISSTGSIASNQCVDCTAGSYCSTQGLANPTGLCDAGYYCPKGQQLKNPPTSLCPQGHKCPVGSPAAVRCSAGTYQDESGQSSCKQCPEGFFCDPTKAPVVLFSGSSCPAGHYCPAGTKFNHEFPCPIGTFSSSQNRVKSQDCISCSAGKFCSSPGQTAVSGPCDAGYYCTSGAKKAKPAPTDATGGICPAGSYCPSGSSTPIKCPAGTFSGTTGLVKEQDCTPCTPGSFCASEGLTAPSGLCKAGHYCSTVSTMEAPNGQVFGSICPAGSYCPQGTGVPIKCPAGTYSSSTSLKAESECLPCAGGKYCPNAGQTSATQDCSAGYYCSGGASVSSPVSSPSGDKCPLGHHCPAGSSQPVPCNAGTYTETVQQATCATCPAGFYCLSTKQPVKCPQGHYCPSGTHTNQIPCPTGTYNPGFQLTKEADCKACEPGKYCKDMGMTAVSGDCDAGFFCTSGVDQKAPAGGHKGSGGKCTVGHYCPAGTASPLPCSPGSFNPLENQATCTPCTAGFYCQDNGLVDISAKPCPAGHYCPTGTSSSNQYPCPAGKFLPSTGGKQASDCVPCTAGKYCATPGLSAETNNCAPGWYCTGGAIISKPTGSTGGMCQPGFYCPAGSAAQVQCSAGSYCATSELGAVSGPCTEGYYCSAGSLFPAPTDGVKGNICPQGHYCPSGSSAGVVCPAGTFSNNKGLKAVSDCSDCTPGFYCANPGQTAVSGPCDAGYFCVGKQKEKNAVANICLEGHFCLQQSPAATRCPLGEYQNQKGKTACITCPEGYYCDNSKSPVVLYTSSDCPKGHYCPAGTKTATQFPCPIGTYSNSLNLAKEADCTNCPAGKFCSVAGKDAPSGDCAPGYYCILKSLTASPIDGITGRPCSPGHFCLSGTTTETKCPIGTYRTAVGGTASSDCTDCDGGKFCSSTGLSAVSGSCSAGFFCTKKAVTSKPTDGTTGNECTVGHHCPAGSAAPVPCQDGTYMPNKQATACLPCPKGFKCTDGINPVTCSAGRYCPEGTGAAEPKCAKGTYLAASGKEKAQDCLQCTGGFYCETTGLTAVTNPCAAGFYCQTGVDVLSPDGSTNTGAGGPCPKGHYCAAQTTSPVACDPGTYNDLLGRSLKSQCKACLPGKYCETSGLASPTGDCSAGFYCASGSATKNPASVTANGGPCPTGNYCPVGTSSPLPCPAGQHNPSTGQTACQQCPKGYFCPAGTSTFGNNPCPSGHYCPSGTKFDKEFKCPVGTFSAATKLELESQCQACTPGKYCMTAGLSAVTGPCQGGWYCSTGAKLPTPASNTEGGKCVKGQVCPLGSSAPSPCPAGSFCATDGLSAVTGPCTEGYYCLEGSKVPNPTDGIQGNICPAGSFCPAGSTTPTPCSIGSFSSSQGNVKSADCQSCTPGFFCSKQGAALVEGSCASGYFCPAGSTTPNKASNICPQGFFCPPGSTAAQRCASGFYQDQTGQSSCKTCPAGSYCDSVTDPKAFVDCPAGHYCPQRTKFATEFPCPKGTFSGSTKLERQDQCTACTPGKYCQTTGLDKPSGDCAAGYYCKGSAITNTPLDGTTGNICPKGHYCAIGVSLPTACPSGKYSQNTGNVDQNGCTPCAAGRYCSQSGGSGGDAPLCKEGFICRGGSNTPTPSDPSMGGLCSAGKYCPAGTVSELECAAGTYNPNTGQAACLDCPAGKLCATKALTAPGECPKGHYCPLKTAIAVPCPAGKYSNVVNLKSSSECTPCPAGKYCEIPPLTAVTGTCDQGYICAGESNSKTPDGSVNPQNKPCPAGFYCPAAATAPIPCPVGTSTDVTGIWQESQCKPCLPGHYCATTGLAAPTGKCAGGYYCPENFKSIVDKPVGKECPAGKHCPPGSVAPVVCPDGKYQGSSTQADCLVCPEGHFCVGSPLAPVKCPIEKYCPSGTGTPPSCPPGLYSTVEGVTGSTLCAKCPVAKYCLDGKIKGPCAAGYWCIAGSDTPTPTGAKPEVGGPCKPGHYCLEGTIEPTTCPTDTTRVDPGAQQKSDCISCPAGFFCIPGDPVAKPCEPGWYCPFGSPKAKCPIGTYNELEKGTSEASCKSCVAGYWCDSVGMANYLNRPCPAGKFCSVGVVKPVNCTSGFYRSDVGGKAITDCTSCPGGFYCPEASITPTLCAAGNYCPSESGGQTVCPPGSFCAAGVKEPTLCPAGFYCAVAATEPIKCPLGSYCPSNSTKPQLCPLGYTSKDTSNATTFDSACTICRAGTYGNHPNRTACLPSAAGYVCLDGCVSATPEIRSQDNGFPCPVGHYCPEGSGFALKCPVATYNPLVKGVNTSSCIQCPAGTYNHKEGQEGCFPCGSSANSTAGQTKCGCTGAFRVFQPSDGSCVCQPGYMFFNDDGSEGTGNSDIDCQPIVYDRCLDSEARSIYDGTCVDPSSGGQYCFSSGVCSDALGVFNPNLGTCDCSNHTECSSSTVTVEISSSNSSLVILTRSDGTAVTIPLSQLTGFSGTPSCVATNTTNCRLEFLQVSNTGTQGLCADSDAFYDQFFQVSGTTGNQTAKNVLSNQGTSRKLLQVIVSNTQTSGVANPILCLLNGESMMFDIPDRNHYPVYDKDSLFNTNEAFDYGEFRELEERLTKTNLTITKFAFTFAEAGTYVFYNAANKTSTTVIVVMPTGTACTGNSGVRVVPQTSANFVASGVNKQRSTNTTPNWLAVIILVSVTVSVIVILIIAVFVWRPKNWGARIPTAFKPRYRRLNAPPQEILKPANVINGEESALSAIAEDAISPETENKLALVRDSDVARNHLLEDNEVLDKFELENFNVKTLYDKLEDQNIYVASLLGKHADGSQSMYEKLLNETGDLKDMLYAVDGSRIEKDRESSDYRGSDSSLTSATSHRMSQDTLHPSKSKRKPGRSPKEEELMETLQNLIKNIKLGVSKPGVSSSSVKTIGGTKHKVVAVSDQKSLTRKQNAERVKLIEDLQDEEQDEFKNNASNWSKAKEKEIAKAAEELKTALEQPGLSDDDADRLMNQYHDHVDELNKRIDLEKARQQAALREKMLKKRREKQLQLQKQHEDSAEAMNLHGLSAINDEVSECMIESEQFAADAIHAELEKEKLEEFIEIEEKANLQLGDQTREAFEEKLKGMVARGEMSEDEMKRLIQEQIDAMRKFDSDLRSKKELLQEKLKAKMAMRKGRLMADLQQKQNDERLALEERLQENSDLSDSEKQVALDNLNKKQEQERAALENTEAMNEAIENATVVKSLLQQQTAQMEEEQQRILSSLGKFDNISDTYKNEIVDELKGQLQENRDALELQKTRQKQNLKEKLKARQKRLEEQRKREAEHQVRQALNSNAKKIESSDKGSETIVVPSVEIPQNSVEEKSLEQQQKQIREKMEKKHREEMELLDQEMLAQQKAKEKEMLQKMEIKKEQILREKQARVDAELNARTDLSQEEANVLLSHHQAEIEQLNKSLDQEKIRQQAALREKLAAKKKRQREDLKRRQELDKHKEELQQDKELTEMKTEKLKELEREAIIEGIQSNDKDKASDVIHKILEQRHKREQAELEKQYQKEKNITVEDALLKLSARHEDEREKLAVKHSEELRNLMANLESMTDDDLEAARIDLINRQQVEEGRLEKELANEKKNLSRDAVTELDLKYAHERLRLKENQYLEFSETLKEFTPEQALSNQALLDATAAEETARELELLRSKLGAEKEEQEKQLQEEKAKFEEEERLRLEAELNNFEEQLEKDKAIEAEKVNRAIEELNAKKEQMLADRKAKQEKELEELGNVSKDEKDAILSKHTEELQKFENALDTERVRQQSVLKERLAKKRESKRKAKLDQLQQEMKEKVQEKEEDIKENLNKLRDEEIKALEESQLAEPAVYEAAVVSDSSSGTVGSGPGGLLSEQEMMELLMKSPLISKLEEIEEILKKGGTNHPPSESNVQPYRDAKDELIVSSKLVPSDISGLSPRYFILYRFGTFLTDILYSRDKVAAPITLLLADSLPPNDYEGNAFRNSVHYNSHNRILFVHKERLDSIGDFILIIVHSLAHIKSNNMGGDFNVKFLKEFYKLMKVMCEDFFFSRSKNSNAFFSSLKDDSKGSEKQILEEIFARKGVEEQEKHNIVEELIDIKTAASSGDNTSSAYFSKNILLGRLQQYSTHVIDSKLREHIANLEDRVNTFGVEDDAFDYIEDRINDIQSRYKMPDTLQLSTYSTVENTSRQTKKSSSVAVGAYESFLASQINDLQEKVDTLSSEYIFLMKESSEKSKLIGKLDEDRLKKLAILKELKDGTSQFTETKENLKALTVRLQKTKSYRQTIADKMDVAQKRLNGFKEELSLKQKKAAESTKRT
eukprot:Nk52_evm45s621 gene=Nk52_evmTU45s621